MSEQKTKARRTKDAILAEIFNAYKEAGILYSKTTNPRIRDGLLAIKHGCDLAVARLMPLDGQLENLLEDINRQFSD